jgi:hypothetical protein
MILNLEVLQKVNKDGEMRQRGPKEVVRSIRNYAGSASQKKPMEQCPISKDDHIQKRQVHGTPTIHVLPVHSQVPINSVVFQ